MNLNLINIPIILRIRYACIFIFCSGSPLVIGISDKKRTYLTRFTFQLGTNLFSYIIARNF